MFTGIIEELGTVTRWEHDGDSATLQIHGPIAVSDAQLGDSIAVNGLCLTVTENDQEHFSAFVMGVSIEMSTLAGIAVGDRVNLERAAALGHRLGGHIVQGHVDGVTRVIEIRDETDWKVLRFAIDSELAPLLVRKGSITVDGVSLTVSDLSDAAEHEQWFEVSLIPETLERTTLGRKTVGSRANLETDMVARHIARMAEFTRGGTK
ncbi:riboflavin synthase [Humidisolicoccus flavus]|uniref:riboflavin synthase n=1 Tax=Humidisolicoccus flavus TaxID=3111414 RepID=UPI0032495FF4